MSEPTIQGTFDLAVQYHKSGRLPEAEQLYRQVLARQPQHADALNALGTIAHQSGQSELAVNLIRRSIALNPGVAHAHSNLGNALISLGRIDEAIAEYRQAIAIEPDNPKPYTNLGSALSEKGELDDAIAAYRRAIALNPDSSLTHANLGNALRDKGELDEAIAACRQAIALRPDFAEAYSNLANALSDNRPLDEAIAAYRQAIALKPDFSDAHYNLSLALLKKGDLREGWEEYEWRWKSTNFPSTPRNFDQPAWDGGSFATRTLLLHGEQGFGDAIQFIRYLPLVAQRGGKIIVECRAELRELFGAIGSGSQIVVRGQPLPRFDLHCPLLSLPRAFGTTLSDLPREIPYLRADKEGVKNWRRRLGDDRTNLQVGLAWAGSHTHKNDRNRSLQLARLAPLARVPGVRLVSLQVGKAAAETTALPSGMEIADWANELKTFADTAALIANLDLVIAVDTAIVHLAGAMGKPVWVMLPFVSDWRWLLEREDTPWYPTMRLFRQTSRGDWEGVIERVAEALAHWNKNQ
jgi:tetratricopeptide (TPR) repeat protein